MYSRVTRTCSQRKALNLTTESSCDDALEGLEEYPLKDRRLHVHNFILRGDERAQSFMNSAGVCGMYIVVAGRSMTLHSGKIYICTYTEEPIVVV